jgi:hypothetical protein
MFSEADPAKEIMKSNILHDLEEIFFKSKEVNPYFTEGALAEEHDKLIRADSDANMAQAKELIKRAKEIDPDGTRAAVMDLLEKYHGIMQQFMFDEITSYMRLKY